MKNIRWISIVAAVVLAAVIGGIAYNAGVAVGMEQAGTIGHRPWGFPFFFAPLFFILFWFVILRGFFWRGHGWRNRCGGGLDEWHRRAHERMWNDPSGEGPRESTAR